MPFIHYFYSKGSLNKMRLNFLSFARSKDAIPYIIICVSLILALLPVILTANYIRQDDLMWEIWPTMKISDFGYLYYNIVFQLVRPLCMISIYATNLISINITNAIFVRMASVCLICFEGILLYRWALLFNTDRLLALTFAIAAFTLPAYQIFAATGNYILMIIALLMTLGSAFFWHFAVFGDPKKRRIQYSLGCLLFGLSLMAYPLSSMYIFVLVAIAYLNILQPHAYQGSRKLQWIYLAIISPIILMVVYYLFSRAFQRILHVHLDARSSVIHASNLWLQIKQLGNVLNWHAQLWWWNSTSMHLSGIACVLSLFFACALYLQNRSVKKSCISFFLVVCLIVLAYSPVLAGPEFQGTFRYSLATMPIFLYAFFWSLWVCGARTKVLSLIAPTALILLTFFGIFSANINLAENVVGPHVQDFQYVQDILQKQVIPHLQKNEKVFVQATDCDNGVRPLSDRVKNMEYGMRICQYPQQIVGVVIHSLMQQGYASNYNHMNDAIYNENKITLKNMPWGSMVVNSALTKQEHLQPQNAHQILIDTRKMPPYRPFSFYKNLLGISA